MLFWYTSKTLVLFFKFSACTFLACSKNCRPISFNYYAFFFLCYFLGDLELDCTFYSSLDFCFFYSFNSWDLSLPIAKCRFSSTLIMNWSLLCSFSIIAQSSFSFSCLTDLVNAILSSSFNSFSYYFFNFSSYNLSLIASFSILLKIVFSILPN